MRITSLNAIKPIKDSVTAKDVPDYADILSPTGDGGFLCRIREVPESMAHLLPEHVTVEQVGERESPEGSYTYPVLRKTFDAPEVVWKLEPRKYGSARWNRHWEESEEEKARRLKKERVEAVTSLLAEKLATSGDSIEAAVDKLLGDRGFEPTPVAASEVVEEGDQPAAPTPAPEAPETNVPSVEVSGFTATMDRPGTWTLPDGSTVDGKKDDALEALEVFVESVTTGGDAE